MQLTRYYTRVARSLDRPYLEGVDLSDLPWSVQAAITELHLDPDELTPHKFSVALRENSEILEEKTGRMPREVLDDLDQYFAENQ